MRSANASWEATDEGLTLGFQLNLGTAWASIFRTSFCPVKASPLYLGTRYTCMHLFLGAMQQLAILLSHLLLGNWVTANPLGLSFLTCKMGIIVFILLA